MVGRPLIRSRAKVNNIEVQDIMVCDEGKRKTKRIFLIQINIFSSTKSSTNA
jgi:hypothetical protein